MHVNVEYACKPLRFRMKTIIVVILKPMSPLFSSGSIIILMVLGGRICDLTRENVH